MRTPAITAPIGWASDHTPEPSPVISAARSGGTRSTRSGMFNAVHTPLASPMKPIATRACGTSRACEPADREDRLLAEPIGEEAGRNRGNDRPDESRQEELKGIALGRPELVHAEAGEVGKHPA